MSRSSRFSSWRSWVLVIAVLLAASACAAGATEPMPEEPACTRLPGPAGPADEGACVTMN